MPKPSVSDSSSPRLQECQRRAPLIPPVLGPRLSFVKLKIFPPGTSFCQRLDIRGMAVQCHFLTVSPHCFSARETEMGQHEQGASVILGPGPAVDLPPASGLPLSLSQGSRQ